MAANLAGHLCRDRDAVQLAITTPWSNGAIEGTDQPAEGDQTADVRTGGFEPLKALVLPWEELAPY
jgi:hypothetical protein